MRRDVRRFSIGIAVVLASASALFACADLLGLDEIEYTSADSSVDRTDDDGGRDTDARIPANCEAGLNAFNLEGCPCAKDGELRNCYFGSPGQASACNKAGSQACRSGVWTNCAGASLPDAEACFDGIDNDCNGRVDEGCMCGPDIDLCRDGGGLLDPNKYTMFTVPSAPLEGRPFDLYVVSTVGFGRPALVNLGSNVTPDGGNAFYCWGDAAAAPCPSIGAGCPADAGWYAVRHHLTVNAAGSFSFFFYPDQTNPCDGTPSASRSVPISAISDAGAD